MATATSNLPDIRSLPQDLFPPPVVEGAPAPGARVRQVIARYRGTEVYHALYLPADWQSDDFSAGQSASKRYPVIIEYAGNGPYSNAYGDTCTGRVEDCNLGYGISAGRGYIWACLPYVSEDHACGARHNQLQWWGDVQATIVYCRAAVAEICDTYGGDPSAVILAGFSRGAIACNFIGLHDDRIAGLWRAFIAHSHYDGVRPWPYAGSDRRSAMERLKRLRGRPQFISHEGSVHDTQDYLEQADADGVFTFQPLSYRNHTDTWVLRDIPERKALRKWIQNVLKTAPRDRQDGQDF
jgi:hypothetical protein